MNAHQLGAGGVILNTIVVDSLNVFPNLIDAAQGGTIGDTWNGTAIVKKPRDLAAEKAAFIIQIDTDADALIRAVIGERASQYEGAEREALAYKAAGYTGVVPPKVQAWATAKNQTATWAADSQIATAAAWRTAEDSLYAKRLLLKENARNAVDAAALDAVKVQWAAFLAALKGQLGL
ncbi:MAG: hypothetical protein WA191_06740 [Telluria sp.]